MAANSTPALNDITVHELDEVLKGIAAIDPLVELSLQSKKLSAVSTGSGSPCLNLLRVTEKCAKEAETVDFVVIVGMGRAIHTNYTARFSCDSLKLAVIKNESVADFLGGRNFDAICDFQVRSRKRKGMD